MSCDRVRLTSEQIGQAARFLREFAPKSTWAFGIRRDDVRGAVHDALFEMVAGRARIEPGSCIEAFSVGVYRNVVRRRQRERANLRQRALDFAPAAPTQVSRPPGDPVTMDDLLEACGSELTRNQLVCLEKYREAGSYAAAARALDMDDGNLRKTVMRAIKRLKTCARRKKIGPFAQK